MQFMVQKDLIQHRPLLLTASPPPPSPKETDFSNVELSKISLKLQRSSQTFKIEDDIEEWRNDWETMPPVARSHPINAQYKFTRLSLHFFLLTHALFCWPWNVASLFWERVTQTEFPTCVGSFCGSCWHPWKRQESVPEDVTLKDCFFIRALAVCCHFTLPWSCILMAVYSSRR
jgi:hypothetical protein